MIAPLPDLGLIAGEDVTVHLRGGDLSVCVTPSAVFMTGPAAFAFEGDVEI